MELVVEYQDEVDDVQHLLGGLASGLVTGDAEQLLCDRLARGRSVAAAALWSRAGDGAAGAFELRGLAAAPALEERAKAIAAARAACRRTDPDSVPAYVAASREPLEYADLENDGDDWDLLSWARRAGLRGFFARPLLQHEEVLGILAGWSWRPLEPENRPWLGLISQLAVGALAHRQTFARVRNLRAYVVAEAAATRDEQLAKQTLSQVVGRSLPMQAVLNTIRGVAPADTPVLITGEPGTGKEWVARAIHEQSARADRPLVRVHCASAPHVFCEEALLGGGPGQAGRLAAAGGGVLFLEEVADTPLSTQAWLVELLRSARDLQARGGGGAHPDVRVIAATSRDLARAVAAGRFRQDLHRLLGGCIIQTPPLRDRLEDVPILARHVADQAARRLKQPAPEFTQQDLTRLQSYHWPGNVRELQDVVERAVLLARGTALDFDLPAPRRNLEFADITLESHHGARIQNVLPDAEMRRRERANVLAALNQAGGRIHGPRGAAALLGVKATTLTYRLKKMGIDRPPRGGKPPQPE